MHVQTHMSRPTPNETIHQLPSISQQNGIPLLSQVQPDELRKSSGVYSDLSDDRKFVQERIVQYFRQRQIPSEMQQKFLEITRRFDEHLFNEACSREEYINMDTLERRLHSCIQQTKRLGQQRKLSSLVNSVSSIGTMVPTPGFYQTTGRNSSRLSQGDNFVNASNMVLSTSGSKVVHGGSFNVSCGCVTNGTHQSPVNISTEFCRNYVMPAKSIQNTGNQMLPTPGLSNKKSMHTNTKVFPGDEYLIHGEPRNLSFLPSSIRSTMCKQNPGNLVASEKPNSRNNSRLLSSLAVRQLAQMKSHLYNESRKVNIESACSHSKHGMRLGISHHEQLQLPHAQFIGNQDSLAVENKQPLVKYDRVKNSHLVIEAGNQNLVDHRVDLLVVRSHAPISEQSQLTGSQVDFREQNNLGEDYKGDQAHKSVGSCDVHPSLQSDSLSQEQGKATISSNKKFEDDFREHIIDLDEALQPLISVEELAADNSAFFNGGTVSEGSTRVGFVNVKQEQGYKKQQRWLLFLRHARTCSAPNGKCRDSNCFKAQELWQHMFQCKVKTCSYPSCLYSKALVEHHIHCQAGNCPVCIPVRRFLALQHKAQIRTKAVNGNPMKNSLDSNRSTLGSVNVPRISSKNGEQITEIPEEQKISVKRMKIEHSSTDIVVKLEGSVENSACEKQYNPQGVTPNLHVQRPPAMKVDVKEAVKVKAEENFSNSHPVTSILPQVMVENLANIHNEKPALTSSMKDKHSNNGKTEIVVNEEQENPKKVMLEQKIATESTSPVTGTKSTKLKIKGVSLIELFTPEQVREHINSLRQWVGQSKPKAEKNHASGLLFSENSCQLCGVEKLTFDPPLIYCSKCGSRIKRSVMYYTRGIGDTRHFFCVQCFSEARGELVEIDGNPVPKSGLEKKENDEETEEGWVQCDKCEGWQHQVCALFNIRRNEGQAEYTCPPCYIAAIENGGRKPLPQSTVLGAKDLPRTVLSDHIEQRLAKKLKQERQDRAKLAGKNFDEVPGAEALVVRVVLSVDKRLEVKQQFLENFLVENYPTEFTYKSKVILLFQKIEGIEVCLFGMYVQEFGSECSFPNQRRVYLSYLDSVKYFRPQIKAVSGEALRTFVYHEILIGYLEYCKIRGFTSCYIWACPPLKGEDYILYCHPEIQKTPKSDKLREWYLSMLRKASNENIVVEVTNFYDHFFTSAGECKTKVTASRLPYFEGDYWPGAAEDLITQLHQDEGRKQQNKVKMKKFLTKRALKTAGSFDPSCNVSKEVLIMQRLGEIIYPMKEDFIMVHLQYACSYCCHHIVFGKRWVCRNCRSFRLCDKCYDDEQKLEERKRHPANSRDKHFLLPVEINDVPADTNDSDEILDSEFFDTRQAFLSLCQGNHYQYDTLRRAKHSSMMVLYHLHNPTAPAFASKCNICLLDIDTGQGWRCEVCPDFDVCDTCYRKDNKFRHPHTLTNHPSMADHDAQNQEARQQRVWQLQRMLGLLGHASQCRSAQCKYPKCCKVKTLFRHGIQCTIRASGGCSLCGKIWYLLRLHARACKQSECLVPRCKDLKEHMKRLQKQADSRRRAAVMEMMRQRAVERKVG